MLLRVVEDLSIEQVARALGKRPTAVKALQHRALATLRRLLVDEGVFPVATDGVHSGGMRRREADDEVIRALQEGRTPDDRPELAGLASLMAELRSVHDDASGPGRRVTGPGLCTRLVLDDHGARVHHHHGSGTPDHEHHRSQDEHVLAQAVDHGPLGLKPGAKTGRSP